MPPSAPPRPRLGDLDPEAFADSIVGAVDAHLRALLLQVAEQPRLDLSLLRRAVLRLALYARTGEPLDDPFGAIQQLHQVLYGCPANVTPIPGLDPLQDDPQDLPPTVSGWAKLVSLAAKARERLATGQLVPVAELAALTDSSADHVRLKIRRGELRGLGTGARGALMVHHGDASAWVQARAVSLH